MGDWDHFLTAAARLCVYWRTQLEEVKWVGALSPHARPLSSVGESVTGCCLSASCPLAVGKQEREREREREWETGEGGGGSVTEPTEPTGGGERREGGQVR